MKISGEALKGEQVFGIAPEYVEEVVKTITEIKKQWHEIAIVVGGGNIYRWSNLISAWVKSADSHNLSMLSTVFNGVVLHNFLEKVWIESVVLDPLGIDFLEQYNKDSAKRYLEEWKVVICVWGTSNPYFTTDTGGVLRSLELECEKMIKATKVDGIYDKDPMKHADAKKYDSISYESVIEQNLKILDQTAVSLAKENNQVLQVLKLEDRETLLSAINWEKVGSIICKL